MRTVLLNGQIPDLPATQRLAAVNYGHFTSMQVRGRAVRGLALHFARLADGNEAFFDWTIGVEDEHRVRELIVQALGDEQDASVRVGFVPGEDEYGPPDVLVSVREPVDERPGEPLRVRTDGYRRDWPEHKHAATMGLSYAIRRARRDGFDDALFVGPDNLVREGSVWNVAFFDGDQIIWPQAPMLKGVTMVLLQLALSMNGTPWTMRPVDAAEMPLLAGAAAVNSICPAQPIASVDGVPFGEDGKLIDLLLDAWQSVPFDAL